MIDPHLVTAQPEAVKSRLAIRNAEAVAAVEPALRADVERRELQTTLDQQRAERNNANELMRKLDKKSPEFAANRDRLRALSDQVKAGEERLAALELQRDTLLQNVPNLPHESVPAGGGETANVVISTWGERPQYDFTPKAHWDLGPELGIMDFERAAKISGARFTVLLGAGSRLSRALAQFMLDLHGSRGYREMNPPYLVRREAMIGTGQLPKFEDDAFKTMGENELFLIPTAEVPVTNYHRDEILDGERLPIKYCAYSACFRAEAGSAGKDTRGLIRQHQFEKVEIVKFVTPETSYAELDLLRGDAEEVLRQLGLHYRVVALCGGDLGFCSAKTYDLEVWLPGQNAYREISSCSNFEAFQARRAQIRYRPAGDPKAKPRLVHTLNGSGLAIGRTVVAIVEQFQRADGSIDIPAPLQRYMNGQTRITREGSA